MHIRTSELIILVMCKLISLSGLTAQTKKIWQDVDCYIWSTQLALIIAREADRLVIFRHMRGISIYIVVITGWRLLTILLIGTRHIIAPLGDRGPKTRLMYIPMRAETLLFLVLLGRMAPRTRLSVIFK